MTTEPLVEVSVPASVEQVWVYLRKPALIRRWFGWEYDGLDREIELIFVEEAVADEQARTIQWDHGGQHGDRFELEPSGDGTTLRLYRWGPVPSADDYDDIGEGWITFVQQLSFALARHPGEERRTRYLSADAGLPVVEALEATGSEVWFRSEHQIGITAGELGDGLLVGVQKPGAFTSLTLTAYRNGAAGLQAAGDRWAAWFEERAEPEG